jgi:dUTP pyrophosphatase
MNDDSTEPPARQLDDGPDDLDHDPDDVPAADQAERAGRGAMTRVSERSVILFEPLHDDVEIPSRATEHSAGYDLRAYLLGNPTVRLSLPGRQYEGTPQRAGDSAELELLPGEKAIVPLGFRATLPAGFEAQIRPRSGTSFRTTLALANAPGTIDPDYNAEWGVLVRNDGPLPIFIAHGERIAQMVISRYEVLEFQVGEVRRTTERDGGFGSTGQR